MLRPLMMILIAGALAAPSCKTPQSNSDEVTVLSPENGVKAVGETLTSDWPSEEKVVLRIKRTPCFGSCPVYTLTVFDDGSVRYAGVQFVENLGSFRGTMSTDQLAALEGQLEELNFYELRDDYPSGEMRIMDLPSIYITARFGGRDKTIHNRNYANPDAPGEQDVVDALRAFHTGIEDLVNGMRWEPAEAGGNH